MHCPLAAHHPCPVLGQLAARCPCPVLGQLAAHCPFTAVLVLSMLRADRSLRSVPVLSLLCTVRSPLPLSSLIPVAHLTLCHYTLLHEPNSPSGGRTPETTQEPLEFLKNPLSIADEMSGELSQPAHPVYLEISADLLEKLRFISTSGAFAADATLHSAFANVKQLVKEIFDAPAAYPA